MFENDGEWLSSREGAELLGTKQTNLLYYAKIGEIEYQEGEKNKERTYKRADILKVRRRLRNKAKKGVPSPEIPHIDWMYSKDLAAGVKLAQARYDESVDLAEMAVYQSWRKNNEHLTLAAFSPDRQEAYASIQVVPLPEQVILDVLTGKRTENSIQPDEIRSYDEPGEYTLLGTSAIALKNRPELLLKLLRHYMGFWIDMFPTRYITRIYAQAVSDSGDRLASSLFMAPRYDLAGPYPSYMLDLARPGRSKLIGWFQGQMKDKAIQEGTEFPPDELRYTYTPPILPMVQPQIQQPAQVTTPVRAAVSSLLKKTTPTPAIKSDRNALPNDMVNFTHFYRRHQIADATAGRGRIAGKYQATQGKWRDESGHVIQWALDPAQQRDFCKYFKRLSPDAKLMECDDPACVCHSV